jgi:hypothetical protein
MDLCTAVSERVVASRSGDAGSWGGVDPATVTEYTWWCDQAPGA